LFLQLYNNIKQARIRGHLVKQHVRIVHLVVTATKAVQIAVLLLRITSSSMGELSHVPPTRNVSVCSRLPFLWKRFG
jgi:hypothetical protein